MPPLTMPSGAQFALEQPSLRALMASDGSVLGVAGAVWTHPELAVERLREDDLRFIVSWVVEELPADPEAVALAQVCAAFGRAPSERMGVSDPVLALQIDAKLLSTITKTRPAAGAPAPESSETAVRFAVEV